VRINFAENFKMALDSIRANKLRSFLTMLGIIIGISSVITILSLGAGGTASITGQFEKIGASTVSIQVNEQKSQKSDYFGLKDTDMLIKKISSVKFASPVTQIQGSIETSKKSKMSIIAGGNDDLQQINGLEMLYGRFFSQRDYLKGNNVIVIDQVSAKNLFGYEDVVGQSVNMGSPLSPKKAKIIGVSKSSGLLFAGEGTEMPIFVYTPVTFMQKLYPNMLIGSINIIASSKDKTEEAGNLSLRILENIHHNQDRDVYKAESVMKQLDQINSIFAIFTSFIAAVASIALLVGGIGVMNIMLVSVTERTREIGIRKALGATTHTILTQFLTESVIITVIGGLIGLILGIVSAYGLGSIANITPVISPIAVIGVILFSSVVGIFFGIYPARKAAKLNPIDALRYE
jgi:putative ABC transport system permease protein